MADAREEILLRIEAALTEAGGFSVKRMDVGFDVSDLPAVMLFDGSESVQTKAPYSVTPMLVDMHPVLALNVAAESPGPALNALRAQVLKALLYDVELKTLCANGSRDKIHYTGCETGSELAETLHADMTLNFELTYIFNPATL